MLSKEISFNINAAGKVITDKPTLWHCHDTRSLRCLWTLEEMGIDYNVVEMQFPPRINEPDYKQLNVLGTVPYFVDGDVHMTESSAICDYLTQRYARTDLKLAADHPEFGDYLNWLYMSDATLLFPQTLVLRYSRFEPKERLQPQVVEDYQQWFLARLKKLDLHIVGREYLVDNRFTIADITVGYALYFGEVQGLAAGYSAQVKSYLAGLKQRPAFQRVVSVGSELSPFLHPELWTMRK
jgi:glutathione S-transferase